MNTHHWHHVIENGVECVEYDGYLISLQELVERPTFWTDQVGEKIWGTVPVVGELAAIAAVHAYPASI